MSVIQVQAPGLLTTVQDLGREGFGPMGVSPSGAADPISLRLGNRLVGNAESAAGLEMTLLGGTFLFPQGAILALTGSDFGATLDGAAVAMGRSFEVAPRQTLRLGPTRSGARCYLCRSRRNRRANFSAERFDAHFERTRRFRRPAATGRRCAAYRIRATNLFRKRAIAPQISERFSPRKILRVTPGPQFDWFPESSLQSFYEGTYRVGEQSNRMGLRLEGTPVAPRQTGEMITEGVSLGAIQVPAGGLPIILFVDQQTTGGYPKIANVISADLHRVGQLRPRDEIRFEQVAFETARSLLIEQEQLLASEESILE